MFCYMERNANSATIRQAQRNLNINLLAFYVFSKYPHFSHFVESVHNRSFYVVFGFYAQNDLLAVNWSNF